MMVQKIYESVKTSRGVDYRYLGIGKFSVYIGPKDTPEIINEDNVLKLLEFLDHLEADEMTAYATERSKLVDSLSEAKKREYGKLRKQELQTRFRSFRKLSVNDVWTFLDTIEKESPQIGRGDKSSKI